MLMLILEAAIRSVLMASAVWAGIRLFSVRNVLAQKVAWVLVLAAAVAMPLAMRAPVPASVAAIRIPLDRLVPHRQPANPTAGNNAHKEPASASATLTVTAPPRLPKPRAGRRADPDEFAGIAEEAPGSVTVTAAPPFAMAPPAPVRPVSPATPTAWERAATWIPLGYLAIAGILLLRVAWSLAAAFGIWLRAAPAGDRAVRNRAHGARCVRRRRPAIRLPGLRPRCGIGAGRHQRGRAALCRIVCRLRQEAGVAFT